ncbi:hypothetical protein AMAG_20685 [Allomyces macrogynus ATCC 38327]|uniref:Uncharacterized protein n=1 Tax=Allomyces macrogynus (strain ATCC 38327) TaxID=578462 RepID=A0A0L0TEN3_ALLM3|nr:hypothetical protein AMAG_20685 [Allomyces macrogynus ATCC 38327]|eukprot:KNE73029.1 hypothetical protein AMAG_20685 [Allomyces macrogynus ATCC 38327]
MTCGTVGFWSNRPDQIQRTEAGVLSDRSFDDSSLVLTALTPRGLDPPRDAAEFLAVSARKGQRHGAPVAASVCSQSFPGQDARRRVDWCSCAAQLCKRRLAAPHRQCWCG